MPASRYPGSRNPGSNAFHVDTWHDGCPEVVPVDLGGRPFVWCPACRCLASMEAVAFKADVTASHAAAAAATPPQPTEASK